MKYSLALIVLLAVASVSGCAQTPDAAEAPVERLSTEQTCSELKAVLALENEDVATEGAADQVGEQMALLAAKASTVVSEDIKLTAEMSSGVYGTMGEVNANQELSDKYHAALARLGRVCDIDWLKDQ
ncbi:hypothetical protein [Arthrobacter crystallopoietes]|uniref:hypothetical protein n=1 Tax=Crystallibacter crystallopoietes TaxID=37928 RepID=UPI001ABE1621|nr:hypothetical protein [Arthrobacter crystallopoietes]QTG81749.1 hypothetical protein J5251_03875 [Arthrobacter crystallopoietes]